MNTTKKRRCGYVTEEQKYVLIEFMRMHPKLKAAKFSATFTFKDAHILWKEISETLHAIPGAVKSWQQWRKTWQDIRYKMKSKGIEIRRHKGATGGGPASSQQLSVLDENVASMIDKTEIQDHLSVPESCAAFDWPDNTGASDFLASENVDVEVSEANRSLSTSPAPSSHGTKRPARQTAAMGRRTIAELTDVNSKDQAIREQYYKRKLELYERQVVAQEQLVAEVKEIKEIVKESFEYLE